MNFRLISEYPWWFFVLCLLFGALISWLLYFYRKNRDFNRSTIWILAILRFLSISLLSFLIFSPMVRTIKHSTIKPAIIFGIDNSSSMIMNQDSMFYKSQFIQEVEELKSELENDYEVRIYNFGERVETDKSISFNDQLTDISSLFRDINTRYYNRNVGALIIASDGIYNTGSDPLYEMRNSKYPVFTILAGDTVSRKDIRIQKVTHNKTAFKGNRFPVEITLQAVESAGEVINLKILNQDNSVIFNNETSISSSNQVVTIPAFIEAVETGLVRLKIVVNVVEGEVNKENNERDIFIEIKESKLKVAIVTELPHPDVAALQRVIGNSNNFETEIFMANEFLAQKPESFNLIILNQLPSIKNQYKLPLERILKSKTPILFILGSESNIQLFNSINTGITLANYKGSLNEALPVLNSSFSLFIISENQHSLCEKLPPLISPFASYKISNSVNVLAYQQVGSTKTDMPLVLFNDIADNRFGVIAGEGIWKWRVYDYIQNKTHQNFDEIISKIFQFMTAQNDKSRFRVDWKNIYAENENIEFNAILFNEAFETVTDKEVTLEITDENKRKFDFAFSAGDQSYSLKMGTFEPGLYTFVAKAKFPNEELTKTGSFVVTDIELENTNLTANHRLLKSLAIESGGKFYYPSNFKSMVDDIHANQEVKSISYSRKYYTDLIDYLPLMIMLFLLMGIEWFLRKYLGSY